MLDQSARSNFFNGRIITIVKLFQLDCEMLWRFDTLKQAQNHANDT